MTLRRQHHSNVRESCLCLVSIPILSHDISRIQDGNAASLERFIVLAPPHTLKMFVMTEVLKAEIVRLGLTTTLNNHHVLADTEMLMMGYSTVMSEVGNRLRM